jgi:dipeptidyl-peptidase 4
MKTLTTSIAGLLALLLAACATTDVVQEQNREGADEKPRLTEEDYQRAEAMLSWNLRDKVIRHNVSPEWIDNDRFWYRVTTENGEEYMLVDAAAQTRDHAFDHERLGSVLADLSDSDQDPWDLPLRDLEFSDDMETIRFLMRGDYIECSLADYSCEESGRERHSVSNSVTSPDGSKAAFIRDYNLWVMDMETGEETQLTTEGEEYHGFAINNQGWNRSDTPIVKWSPDSKKISTFRLDERDVEKMTLWRTVEGRPEADIWPYALPGDDVVPMLERVVIDVDEQSKTWLDVEPAHQRTSNCCGLTRGQDWADNEWNEDGSRLAFVSTSRDYKEVTLYVADPASGEVREVYHERDEIFFESNLTSRGVPNWRVLDDSNEFIWFTRKDNWGHLYLHDLQTGEEKNRITEGDWNVVDILRVDEEARIIWFTAVGKEEGVDPYYEFLYTINFDGSDLTQLTPEPLNHQVNLSPGGDYIVSTHSDFTTPQESVLRSASGEILMELEQADISALEETGWQKPIPFSAKARDGETDIYGVMLLPSNFDENKSYPIVNNIYPGPQVGSVGSRSFSHNRRGQAQALAELGFVVVQIDGFGTPMRSREFHTYYYGDMSDNGLPDNIAAMEQLAEEYDFIDIERAGMFGHSGGGFATASAMFQYPEFFKVGVSSAGNHDNRGYTYYWGEKFQGLLEETDDGDTYTNQANHLQAENLEGHLLISYGTMDTNVHPAMTLLVVDELIRHNKDFELIVMPNRGHGYANEPYHLRKTWDFFVRHLMGAEPPVEYSIGR